VYVCARVYTFVFAAVGSRWYFIFNRLPARRRRLFSERVKYEGGKKTKPRLPRLESQNDFDPLAIWGDIARVVDYRGRRISDWVFFPPETRRIRVEKKSLLTFTRWRTVGTIFSPFSGFRMQRGRRVLEDIPRANNRHRTTITMTKAQSPFLHRGRFRCRG